MINIINSRHFNLCSQVTHIHTRSSNSTHECTHGPENELQMGYNSGPPYLMKVRESKKKCGWKVPVGVRAVSGYQLTKEQGCTSMMGPANTELVTFVVQLFRLLLSLRISCVFQVFMHFTLIPLSDAIMVLVSINLTFTAVKWQLYKEKNKEMGHEIVIWDYLQLLQC